MPVRVCFRYITKEAIESISKNVPQGDINAIIKETLNVTKQIL